MKVATGHYAAAEGQLAARSAVEQLKVAVWGVNQSERVVQNAANLPRQMDVLG